METKSSTDVNVSFSSTPNTDQDSDFEFSCLSTTPSSPTDQVTHKNSSPADHLFFNGRLLPHSFPLQQKQLSREALLFKDHSNFVAATTSRTSSISSKDSLMSSRSNSTNSSSSSARASSSSDGSERKVLLTYKRGTKLNSSCKAPTATKVVMGQLYGPSQRWQHIVPVPAAVLKREDSRRSSSNQGVHQVTAKDKAKREKSSRSGIWRRFFLLILVACRECHAMEPSKRDDIVQGNMKI